MPKQNRVTPAGDLVAVPARGTMMGNRGVLHDADQQVVRPWQLRRWIVCELAFRGRHRRVMTPGRYTELFFLDEATALAAGHRPCFECRRARYHAFGAAWQRAQPGGGRSPPAADDIDRQLHAERIGERGGKGTYEAELAGLPDGVFVRVPQRADAAHLLWAGGLYAWSPGGYAGRVDRPDRTRVAVLTPRSTVAAIRAGFVPAVHPSVDALPGHPGGVAGS